MCSAVGLLIYAMPIIYTIQLRWQNLLEQQCFKACQVRGWIAAKASLHPPCFMPPFQGSTYLLPCRHIWWLEIRWAPHGESRCHGGDDPDWPTYCYRRRWAFLPGGAPLVVPRRPKILLQIIVRPRHVGQVVAPEQPAPVAHRHRIEVRCPRCQDGISLVCQHVLEHSTIHRCHGRPICALVVGQHLGCPTDPALGDLQRWPELCRGESTRRHQGTEAHQGGRKPPFWCTRSNDSWIAVSR